jgi:hypothetical protein
MPTEEQKVADVREFLAELTDSERRRFIEAAHRKMLQPSFQLFRPIRNRVVIVRRKKTVKVNKKEKTL